ncbi:MAG: hypothetical protein Q9218_001900 [Villophora microphyllina]
MSLEFYDDRTIAETMESPIVRSMNLNPQFHNWTELFALRDYIFQWADNHDTLEHHFDTYIANLPHPSAPKQHKNLPALAFRKELTNIQSKLNFRQNLYFLGDMLWRCDSTIRDLKDVLLGNPNPQTDDEILVVTILSPFIEDEWIEFLHDPMVMDPKYLRFDDGQRRWRYERRYS